MERLTRARRSQRRKEKRLGGKGGLKQPKERRESGEMWGFYKKRKLVNAQVLAFTKLDHESID